MKKEQPNTPKVAVLKSTEKRNDLWSTLLVEVGTSQDRRAFAQLFEHFAPLLKSFAQASRQDGWFPGLAEDLVQEVMIKVWQKAGGYDPRKASATTWIYTVARNCRIDMLRRKCNTQHWRMKISGMNQMKRRRFPCSDKRKLKNRCVKALDNYPVNRMKF